MDEAFLDLSRILTGEEDLDPKLAAAHMERLQARPDLAGPLAAALAKFVELKAAGADLEAAVEREILKDPALAPAIQQAIFLWYAGAFLGPDGKMPEFGGAEPYFSALIWGVIRAHVPGLSGGYFGHWMYAPDR